MTKDAEETMDLLYYLFLLKIENALIAGGCLVMVWNEVLPSHYTIFR